MAIPLDPGSGGKRVGSDALQIADILVSTTNIISYNMGEPAGPVRAK